MNTKNTIKIVSAILLLCLAVSMASTSALAAVVNAKPNEPNTKIWTDKTDYHPGTLV